MTTHAPQHEQSTDNNTVPAAPAWRRTLRRVLLLVFLFTLSTAWLTQIRGCEGWFMDPGEPLKGWELIMPDMKPFIFWAYVAMAACVAVALVVSEPAGRTVPLVVAGRSAARAFALCVLLGAVMAVPIGMATLHWADYHMEGGFYWGAGAIALAVVMELSRLARAVWMLIRQRTLRAIAPRMGPLSWALLAANLLVLGAMGAAAAVDLFHSADTAIKAGDALSRFRVTSIAVVQAAGASSLVALAAATCGLLARQRWAAWLHLSVAAFLIGLLLFLRADSDANAPPWAQWLVPPWHGLGGLITMGVLAAWGLAGWGIGLARSPWPVQRGVCWECGQRFWQRAGRCPMCGQRYRTAPDRATMDVCMACGHERAGRLTLCRLCRQREAKRRLHPDRDAALSSLENQAGHDDTPRAAEVR